MISIDTEQIVSLQDAAERLPRRRGGKKPHLATLYRWSQAGCRGIVLETIQVGGTRCTSVEALQRFFERLSETREPETDTFAPGNKRRTVTTPADIDAQLDEEGLK